MKEQVSSGRKFGLLSTFLLPPKLVSYEQAQKAKLLHVILFATLLGALFFALQNVKWNDFPSAVSFFLLTGVCVLALYLNHRLRFGLAAFLFCASALVVLDYALFSGGASLHDPGIVAYPVFILCTAFLFGRRGLGIAVFLSIASVTMLYLLEAYKISTPLVPSTPNRVLGLSILFIVLALVTAIIRETWDTHLVKLRESYDLTLQGWAKALEYRDGEIEGHSRRVTDLCVTLARKMGSSEEEILQIRRGAYLHDIGKMAIPDRILQKPGPLDDEELAIMKQHPDLALKLITGIPFLQAALSIPYSHHEYWDGTGYPQGLKGAEIPLASRIFTVVDQWDALTSDRPYRKAWPREKVIAHLRENAGKLYDPRIVRVFLDIVGEGKAGSPT